MHLRPFIYALSVYSTISNTYFLPQCNLTLWVRKVDSNIMCEMRRLEKNVNKEEMFFRGWDFLSNGGNISLAWEACKAERNVSVGKTEGK